FTASDIAKLKEYPTIFMLDAFDELATEPDLSLHLWPKAKIFITSRPNNTFQHTEHDYRAYMLPFNQVQIYRYLSQRLSITEDKIEDIMQRLSNVTIRSVLRNPFVLSLFEHIWQETQHWEILSKERIYQ